MYCSVLKLLKFAAACMGKNLIQKEHMRDQIKFWIYMFYSKLG